MAWHARTARDRISGTADHGPPEAAAMRSRLAFAVLGAIQFVLFLAITMILLAQQISRVLPSVVRASMSA